MTQLICGVLRLGAPADAGAERTLVGCMLEKMAPPGLPRAIRLAQRGPMTLGALRLGLTGGDEPPPPALIEAPQRLLAADITIFDRSRMNLTGVRGDAPDGDFLAAALTARGTAALGALHGDFAFANWQDGKLTLGRDHFGARPLHYFLREGAYLAFASLPAALLRTGLAAWEPDEAVAASWVLQPAPPPGRTIWRNIRSVPAAHEVTCGADGTEVRRYWRLDPGPRRPFASDPRELARETARLIALAVERRLPAQGPGAGHLSGGLDSSPIAVLAARMLSQSGRAFYGYTFREPKQGPGLPGAGDAPMADLVADFEPAITQVSIPAPCLLTAYAEGIEPDSALPVSATEPEEQILRHAARQGAAMLLTGWGGDQVVSYQGRGAQADLLRAGRIIRLWQHLREESREAGDGVARLFLATAVMQALPQALRERLRRVAGRETPYHAAMAPRQRLAARHRRSALLRETWPDSGDSHRIRRDSTEAWYIQARLDSFARQGARHGVAYAHPLLDLDLVEFALSVPGVFLRSGADRRVLLRKASVGLLPDAVRLGRAKLQPFPGEDTRIAAAQGPLLALLSRWGKNARIRDILDLEFMAEIVSRAGDPDAPAEFSAVDLTPAFQISGFLAAMEDVAA